MLRLELQRGPMSWISIDDKYIHQSEEGSFGYVAQYS